MEIYKICPIVAQFITAAIKVPVGPQSLQRIADIKTY